MYIGALPQYALHADRKRLVKLLCKGICGHMRWAEVNTDCPDADVLRKLQMGDLTATCLKCGRIARDPYNWVIPKSRRTSGSKRCTLAEANHPEHGNRPPDEAAPAPERPGALRAADLLNTPITTLSTSEFVEAVQQFCAGVSVRKVFHWLRERSDDVYGRSQELIALRMRVQERMQANLGDLTNKVLRPTVSPSTRKYYETAMSLNREAAGATLDKKSAQLTSAWKILDFVFDIIKERGLTWREIQNKCNSLCETQHWDLMLLARGGRSSLLVYRQEQWMESISTAPCESDHAKQRKTASDLDRMIDEVLQFMESRRVLGVVVDHACAQLAEHRTAEIAIGVPSVAAAHDLNTLLTVAEDLRKVELTQTVWRLRQLGRRILAFDSAHSKTRNSTAGHTRRSAAGPLPAAT